MRLVRCKKDFSGRLTKGCKQCVKGRKSVLFITGKCHYNCFYCPISDDKRNVDVVKINERVIHRPDSDEALDALFEEVRLCRSLGVGITGGDPLANVQRTYAYIKALKTEFGKKFHIHVYTSPQFVTKEKLLHLQEAGLDELRFHLDVEHDSLWKKVKLAQDLNFFVGVEVPAIPGLEKESKALLDFCKAQPVIQFVNVNELEYSDTSDKRLSKRGFKVKDRLSYAIKGSEELALKLVAYGKKIHLPVHYCSASFKDGVQLGNRLLWRAKSVAYRFDEVDRQGMLTRGEIRAKQGVTLKEADFDMIASDLIKRCGFSSRQFAIEKDRVVLSAKKTHERFGALQAADWIDLVTIAVVKEYPTDDHFILEKDVLV